MMDRIVASLLKRFGFTEEHSDKIKKFLDMAHFEQVDGKDIMVIRPGNGIEFRITQSEQNSDDKESAA